MDVGQALHWRGEVRVTATPVVNDLRASDPEPTRNLRGVDEIIEVDLPSHMTKVMRGSDTGATPSA